MRIYNFATLTKYDGVSIKPFRPSFSWNGAFWLKTPFVSTLYINVYQYNDLLSCLREMYV